MDGSFFVAAFFFFGAAAFFGLAAALTAAGAATFNTCLPAYVPQKAQALCGSTCLLHLGQVERLIFLRAKCDARRRLWEEVLRWPGKPIFSA